jgi:hypothetical protein
MVNLRPFSGVFFFRPKQGLQFQHASMDIVGSIQAM